MTEGMERGGGIALWRQIAEQIRTEIATGVYAVGDRLPPEADLAARFGVNRHTLRRAMAALAEADVVRIDQGRGTFVQAGRLSYPIRRRTRFSEIVSAQAREPSGRLIGHRLEVADEAVATRLKVAAGTPVHRVESLSVADGVPISLAEHWIPAERFPRLVEVYAETGSFTKVLEAHGVTDYTRRSTRVTARVADALEGQRLGLPPGSAVLVTENIDVDTAGTPVQTSRTLFAGERVELVVEQGDDPA
ncbi:phosphonate metabolism transcriptional regulator PhnF [Chthonobacter rhizosphaerae]|uniref:phosphonate metabolism transcriptional regulator PhnF n=1 Tax=Chthonobacter rhizosphaerae TaxID=2735553 RepID=UPI0015EF12A7|nr:phosphonate metabolism transcriptional regulator PhnF [Chthonobacter rhizosphaerae]